MKEIKHICMVMAIGAGTVCAQTVSDRHLSHSFNPRSMPTFGTMGENNPAMQWQRDSFSLNRMALGYHRRKASIPKMLELGDQTNNMSTRIDAFIRKEKTTLWGFAHYDNNRVRNQKYCETADFQLLYPYIMADTVGGGKSHLEHYDFMGGAAHSTGRWIFGIQGQYTAQMDYRTRDPRPKNLTGNLDIKAGITYLLKAQWAGIALGYNKYKQTNEVKFYNEVAQPAVYHLTGLGTDYFRFRGNNTRTYYKGSGYEVGLNTRPQQRQGVYASATCNYRNFKKIISDLNQLPLNTMKQYIHKASVGYLGDNHARQWGVTVSAENSVRKGWENMFGTASGNIYPEIASAQKYSQKATRVDVTGLYVQSYGNARYSAELSQAYGSMKENHYAPDRMLKTSALTSSLGLKGAWQLKQWVLQCTINGTYTWSKNNKLHIEGTIYPENMPALNQRYNFFSHNRYTVMPTVEALYDTGKQYAFFVKADWQHEAYAPHSHTNYTTLSFGIEF